MREIDLDLLTEKAVAAALDALDQEFDGASCGSQGPLGDTLKNKLERIITASLEKFIAAGHAPFDVVVKK